MYEFVFHLLRNTYFSQWIRAVYIQLERMRFLKRFLPAVFLIFSLSLAGQYANDPGQGNRFWSRVSVGGGLGASFGNVTYVNISPRLGYWVTQRFNAGISFVYLYLRDNDFPDFEFTTVGYGPYANYTILEKQDYFPEIFLSMEYLNMTSDVISDFTGEIVKESFPILFVGGGARLQLGGRAYAQIQLLYDLNESRYSPYQNPLFNVGFIIR